MDWLGLVFPRKCLGCGRWGRYVCEQCQIGLIEVEQACPTCSLPSPFGLRHTRCAGGSILGESCWWEGSGIMKKVLAEVEENGYYDCLSEVADLGVRQFSRSEFQYLRRFLKQNPVVVGLPSAPGLERKLGYNPQQKLADYLAKRLQLPTARVAKGNEDVLLVSCRRNTSFLQQTVEQAVVRDSEKVWVLNVVRDAD